MLMIFGPWTVLIRVLAVSGKVNTSWADRGCTTLCGNVIPMLAAPGKIYALCALDSDCHGHLFCKIDRCALLEEGVRCFDDLQCPHPTSCSPLIHRCISGTRRAYIDGVKCTADNDCAPEMYCTSGRCKPRAKTGGACGGTAGAPCLEWNVCAEKRCVPRCVPSTVCPEPYDTCIVPLEKHAGYCVKIADTGHRKKRLCTTKSILRQPGVPNRPRKRVTFDEKALVNHCSISKEDIVSDPHIREADERQTLKSGIKVPDLQLESGISYFQIGGAVICLLGLAFLVSYIVL